MEDAAFILELVNTPDWIRFIGDRNVHTIEEAAQYIRVRMLPQFERLGYGNFTVREKSTGNPVGTCGIYDREGLEGCDLGFALLPQYYRKGYGFESAQALMHYASENWSVNNLKAITLEVNIPSRMLLEKLGFTLVGPIQLANDPEELLLYTKQSER